MCGNGQFAIGCRFGEERLIGPLSLMGQPKRLEEVLSAVLHRRKEPAEPRSAQFAELRKRATEAEASSLVSMCRRTLLPTH